MAYCKQIVKDGRVVGFMRVAGSASQPKKCQHGRCSAQSAVLCDYRTGSGKTCDTPACRAHSTVVGVNRDYCFKHGNE